MGVLCTGLILVMTEFREGKSSRYNIQITGYSSCSLTI